MEAPKDILKLPRVVVSGDYTHERDPGVVVNTLSISEIARHHERDPLPTEEEITGDSPRTRGKKILAERAEGAEGPPADGPAEAK